MLTNDQNQGQSSGTVPDDSVAYKWMGAMAAAIILILIIGVGIAFYLKNFAIVPFSVVVTGILAFFGVLRVSRALSGSNENEMRKSITVAILVVYLGLLLTLAFQGILQFQVTGNTTSDVAVLNQTVNQTVVQVIPQTVALSETVVTSFTALVAAVLLFYFGSRSLDSYYTYLAGKSGTTPPAAGDSSSNGGESGAGSEVTGEATAKSPTTTAKEVTVERFDKDGNLLEKTVTTERVKDLVETTVVTKKVIKEE